MKLVIEIEFEPEEAAALLAKLVQLFAQASHQTTPATTADGERGGEKRGDEEAPVSGEAVAVSGPPVARRMPIDDITDMFLSGDEGKGATGSVRPPSVRRGSELLGIGYYYWDRRYPRAKVNVYVPEPTLVKTSEGTIGVVYGNVLYTPRMDPSVKSGKIVGLAEEGDYEEITVETFPGATLRDVINHICSEGAGVFIGGSDEGTLVGAFYRKDGECIVSKNISRRSWDSVKVISPIKIIKQGGEKK